MALVGPGCKLGRREAAEADVRAAAVVVGSPRRDLLAGVRHRAEQGLVQAFVAKPAVEALDEGMPDRLAQLDVAPGDARFLAPAQDCGKRTEPWRPPIQIVGGHPFQLMTTANSGRWMRRVVIGGNFNSDDLTWEAPL